MLCLTAEPFRYKRYADQYFDLALRFAHVPRKQAVISPSALSLMYPPEEIPGYPASSASRTSCVSTKRKCVAACGKGACQDGSQSIHASAMRCGEQNRQGTNCGPFGRAVATETVSRLSIAKVVLKCGYRSSRVWPAGSALKCGDERSDWRRRARGRSLVAKPSGNCMICQGSDSARLRGPATSYR
jgi:hypothetical protein